MVNTITKKEVSSRGQTIKIITSKQERDRKSGRFKQLSRERERETTPGAGRGENGGSCHMISNSTIGTSRICIHYVGLLQFKENK